MRKKSAKEQKFSSEWTSIVEKTMKGMECEEILIQYSGVCVWSVANLDFPLNCVAPNLEFEGFFRLIFPFLRFPIPSMRCAEGVTESLLLLTPILLQGFGLVEIIFRPAFFSTNQLIILRALRSWPPFKSFVVQILCVSNSHGRALDRFPRSILSCSGTSAEYE